MTTGVNNEDSHDPMSGYKAWEQAMEQLQSNIAQLQKEVSSEESLFKQLSKEKGSLSNQVNSLEHQLEQYKQLEAVFKALGKPVPKNVKEQESKLQNQLSSVQEKLDAVNKQCSELKSEISKNKQTISDDKKQLGNYSKTSASTVSAKAEASSALKQSIQKQNELSSKQQTAEEQRQSAINAIQDKMKLDQLITEDTILRINNITDDKEDICQDKADLKAEKDQLTEDIIKLSSASAALAAATASCFFDFGLSGPAVAAAAALVAAFTADVVADQQAIDKTNADLSSKESDLTTQESKLSADLTQLQTLSVGDLTSLLKSLFKEVEKILNVLGKGGKVSQGDMEKASALAAQVMSIVEVIEAKAHQMKAQDRQWMDRASAANTKFNTFEAQVNAESLQKLQQYAHFMQTFMKIVQVAVAVLSVLIACATGGTMAIVMTTIMAVLSVSGLMEKMTKALAKAMSHGKDTAGAQAGADAIVAVICMVATLGASAAAEGVQACSQGAQAAAKAGVSIEMANLATIATSIGSSAANTGAQQAVNTAQNAMMTTLRNVTNSIVNMVKALCTTLASAASKATTCVVNFGKASASALGRIATAKTVLAQTVTYWGAANGVVDSAKAIEADSTGQSNVAVDKLKLAEWMKILNIVLMIVQAIMQMQAVSMGCGASEGGVTSLLKNLTGKVGGLGAGLQALTGLQVVAGGFGTYASLQLALNSMYQSQLIPKIGENESELMFNKNMGAMRKLFEKKQVELFAENMEELVSSIYTQIQKNGEADREAAMVLQQSAV